MANLAVCLSDLSNCISFSLSLYLLLSVNYFATMYTVHGVPVVHIFNIKDHWCNAKLRFFNNLLACFMFLND